MFTTLTTERAVQHKTARASRWLPRTTITYFLSLFERNGLDYDFHETDNCYMIAFNVAGFARENIQFNLDRKLLVITADRDKCPIYDEKCHRHHNKKNGHEKFQQLVTLPNHLNLGKLVPMYRDGILSFSFPKVWNKKQLSQVFMREPIEEGAKITEEVGYSNDMSTERIWRPGDQSAIGGD